ncbi:MAG: HDIG domain-containing protein [Candidatus Bathyarchaeia archaeon]|nr:HDIG domain-containing protein [Candidatus Bathyarchaeota archaeon]
MLNPRLKKVVSKIKDKSLRKMTLKFISDLSVTIDGKPYMGLPLEESPASKYHHHSYPGGLLEHTLSTINVAMALCDSAENIYGGRVNRDLVISGIILHDLFKALTYDRRGDGTYRNSPLGERLDHLTLAASELIRRGFPTDLIHIIVASHGESGPIAPKTIEALICHVADEADSKMNFEILNAARYLVREAAGESWDKMDSKTAFKILMLKAEGGWEGLKEGIESIKTKK